MTSHLYQILLRNHEKDAVYTEKLKPERSYKNL